MHRATPVRVETGVGAITVFMHGAALWAGGYQHWRDLPAQTMKPMGNYPFIKLPDSVLVESERSLLNYQAVCVEHGCEGVIVRANTGGHYKFNKYKKRHGAG